jgi:hypothetical protein
LLNGSVVSAPGSLVRGPCAKKGRVHVRYREAWIRTCCDHPHYETGGFFGLPSSSEAAKNRGPRSEVTDQHGGLAEGVDVH